MEIRPEIKEKIVLALDVDTIEQAKELITELKDYVGIFKVGLQMYTGNGYEIFDFMNSQNIKFFFDIKLHWILMSSIGIKIENKYVFIFNKFICFIN